MRNILYITGTRADYGIIGNLLKKADKNPEFQVKIIVTGMHVMKKFGMSMNEIKKDNLDLIKIDCRFDKDDASSMLFFLAKFTEKLTREIIRLKPDFLLVLGDRVEALCGAIVGSYLSVPVVHFHGGELSSNIDDSVRHAITKLSHLHLCATEKSAERIIKMGEYPYRVRVIGSLSLENIRSMKLIPKSQLCKMLELKSNEPIVLVLQHPVTLEEKESYIQMFNTLEAIKQLDYQAVIVHPNSDPGHNGIIKAINIYKSHKRFKIRVNLDYQSFVSLMSIVDIMVGNSSSGIIEAPYFKLPVVNIGSRQNGRERAGNVIDSTYNIRDIKKSILHCLSKRFKNKIKYIRNPYDKGDSSEIVLNMLNTIRIDKKLLQKTLSY